MRGVWGELRRWRRRWGTCVCRSWPRCLCPGDDLQVCGLWRRFRCDQVKEGLHLHHHNMLPAPSASSFVVVVAVRPVHNILALRLQCWSGKLEAPMVRGAARVLLYDNRCWMHDHGISFYDSDSASNSSPNATSNCAATKTAPNPTSAFGRSIQLCSGCRGHMG